MKRRQFVRYTGAVLTAAATTGAIARFQPVQAQSNEALSIQWLGHTCFRFTGGGRRILVNPFRPIGCTAGYRAPQVATDLVMISSRLLDEGVVEGIPGNPRLLAEPGVYQFNGLEVSGVSTDHDRLGGRRFGTNVVWKWNQSGINVVHMGGAASSITVEQQILIGRPDVALIPVGGGPKAYTPEEAVQAVRTLNPKVVIPTHYRTQAADANACDIVALDEFLTLMEGSTIQRVNSDTTSIRRSDLPESGTRVTVLSYSF